MLHTLIKHYKTQEEDITENMCVNEMGISGEDSYSKGLSEVPSAQGRITYCG